MGRVRGKGKGETRKRGNEESRKGKVRKGKIR